MKRYIRSYEDLGDGINDYDEHTSSTGRRGKPCTIIFNTRNGYTMQPIQCKSIAEAIRLAKEEGMAFRIFVDGKCVKSGWYD